MTKKAVYIICIMVKTTTKLGMTLTVPFIQNHLNILIYIKFQELNKWIQGVIIGL